MYGFAKNASANYQEDKLQILRHLCLLSKEPLASRT
jgi:hypothetical protein